jgi:hypothetical protein
VGRIKVAVAISEEAAARIHYVAAACRAVGFEHDSTLGSIGVLTGSVDAEDLPKLRGVPGVLTVETEGALNMRPRPN